jgi:muramoyltetrapeptide carboxypeptidase
VITGAFLECGDPAEIDAVLADRLGDLGVPVLTGANIGHGGHFQAYPIGIAAELDADRAELRLLDPPLVPATS